MPFAYAVTGCRRDEIVGLRWKEADFNRNQLRLSDSKTGASIRPLSDVASALLAEIGERYGICGEFVFPARGGANKPYSGFSKAWHRIVEENYTAHHLRHAFASAAADLEYSEITISALLGHGRRGVTSGYIMKSDQYLLSAANKVASYINSAMNGEERASTGEVIHLSKVMG